MLLGALPQTASYHNQVNQSLESLAKIAGYDDESELVS